jgi:hypothetical protein
VRRLPRCRSGSENICQHEEEAVRFDLLIRGGEVVDPGGGHEGRLDVALPPGAPWTQEPIWPIVQHPFTEKQRELREQGRTPDAMAAAAGEPATGR